LKCKQFWPFTIYVVINDKATEVEEEADLLQKMSFQCSHGNFPFIYLATFGLYLRMEYTYISLYGIPEHVVSKFSGLMVLDSA
jgi:hypothetical protein